MLKNVREHVIHEFDFHSRNELFLLSCFGNKIKCVDFYSTLMLYLKNGVLTQGYPAIYEIQRKARKKN